MNYQTLDDLQSLIYILNVKGFTVFKITTHGTDEHSCVKDKDLFKLHFVNSKIKIGDRVSRGNYTLEIIN